jgi:MFS family permease
LCDRFQYDYGTYDSAVGTKLISAGHQTLMYGVEVGLVFIGSLASGFFAMRWGRKAGLYCCAAAGLLSASVQMISHYPGMVVGRAIMGVGIGFAASFAIAFWSEIAPARLRGRIVILYQFSVNISNFLGSCVDQGTHNLTTAWAYRAPLLTMMIPCLLIFGTIWMVPESPRWLVTRGQNAKARANLAKIRGSTYTPQEVDEEIQEAIKFTALEKELGASTSFAECFKGTDLRRTLVAMMAIVGQQFMGVAFLAGYVTRFSCLSV